MHAFERWSVLQYFRALLKLGVFEKAPRSNEDIIGWINSHGRSVGLPPFFPVEEPAKKGGAGSNPRFRADEWRDWRAMVLSPERDRAPAPSRLQKRVLWLAENCGLSDSERDLLGLVARISHNSVCADLVAAGNGQSDYASIDTAYDLGQLRRFLPQLTQSREIRDGGLAAKFGLIRVDHSGDFRLTDVVEQLLSARRLCAKEVRGLLLGDSQPASLAWEDFDHIGDSRELAGRIVAAGDGLGAANILLYGAPGTGKSEFVKTLGARLGRSVHFVGEKDKQNAEPERFERVAALVVANELGAAAGKMIVVVDEADDLFAGVDEDDASTRHGSKVFMNRLVERTRVPTIWITNDLSRLGPAVIRRMNLIMRFPRPGEAVRRKIVERLARREKFALDARAVGKIASLPAAPALIENAIRSAAKIGGSGEEALQILGGGLKAMGFSEAPPPRRRSASTLRCRAPMSIFPP